MSQLTTGQIVNQSIQTAFPIIEAIGAPDMELSSQIAATGEAAIRLLSICSSPSELLRIYGRGWADDHYFVVSYHPSKKSKIVLTDFWGYDTWHFTTHHVCKGSVINDNDHVIDECGSRIPPLLELLCLARECTLDAAVNFVLKNIPYSPYESALRQLPPLNSQANVHTFNNTNLIYQGGAHALIAQ